MWLCIYGMSINVNGVYHAHVCEQSLWARSAGNSATENVCIIITVLGSTHSHISDLMASKPAQHLHKGWKHLGLFLCEQAHPDSGKTQYFQLFKKETGATSFLQWKKEEGLFELSATAS